MNTQVRGMNVAIHNASDGISMAQVAEGSLSGINDMLQRMREQCGRRLHQSGSDIASWTRVSGTGQEVTRMIDTAVQQRLHRETDCQRYVFRVGANTGTENRITIGSAALATNVAKLNRRNQRRRIFRS